MADAHEGVIVDAAEEPTRVVFDPKDWILKKLTFTKSKDEWLDQLAHSEQLMPRVQAVAGLAALEDDKEAQAALIETATNDKFWGVRQDAVKALAKQKGDDVRKAQLENAIFLSFKKWQPTDVQMAPGPPDPMTGMPSQMLVTPVTALFVPEEDHQVHIAAHLRLLKSPQSIANGPLYVQAIRSHIMQHQQALAQQQAQMMAQQAPPPGQGDGAQPTAAPSA